MVITVVVPEASVLALRAGCAALGSDCDGMFQCAVVKDQELYYIESGHAPAKLVTYINGVVDEYGLEVSEDDPLVTMQRLGMSFVD